MENPEKHQADGVDFNPDADYLKEVTEGGTATVPGESDTSPLTDLEQPSPQFESEGADVPLGTGEGAPEAGPLSPEDVAERLQAFEQTVGDRQNDEISVVKKEKPGVFEGMRERLESFGNWYNKALTPKQKIALGIGLGALGAGAAAVGIAGGIAGGVIGTVMMAKRFAGAAGTYAMLEAGLAKAYEKRGVERSKLHKAFGTAGALTLSALIGGGAVSEGVRNVMDYVNGDEAVATAAALKETGIEGKAGDTPVVLEEVLVSPNSVPNLTMEISSEYEVHTGDNLSNIIKSQLLSGEEYKDLTAGQRENITANLIATLKANPTSFGIASGDINTLNVGDTLNVAKIQEVLNTARVGGESLLAHAGHLGEVPGNIPELIPADVHAGIPSPDMNIESHEDVAEMAHNSNGSGEVPTEDHVMEEVKTGNFLESSQSVSQVPENMATEHVDAQKEVAPIETGVNDLAPRSVEVVPEQPVLTSEQLRDQQVEAAAKSVELDKSELKYFGKASKEIQFQLQSDPYRPGDMTELRGQNGIEAFVREHSKIPRPAGTPNIGPGGIPWQPTPGMEGREVMEHGYDPKGAIASREEREFITANLIRLMENHPEAFGVVGNPDNQLPRVMEVSKTKMHNLVIALHQVYEKKEHNSDGFLKKFAAAAVKGVKKRYL